MTRYYSNAFERLAALRYAKHRECRASMRPGRIGSDVIREHRRHLRMAKVDARLAARGLPTYTRSGARLYHFPQPSQL